MSAARLVLGVPQVLESCTRIISFHPPLVDQIVEERTQRAHLKVDGRRRDQALMPQALLLLAADLVVISVGSSDRLDVFSVAGQPLKMVEHLTVAAYGL